MSPLSGDSPDPLAMGGLSLILLLLVKVKPTKGRWTVRAVILLGAMGSDWVKGEGERGGGGGGGGEEKREGE